MSQALYLVYYKMKIRNGGDIIEPPSILGIFSSENEAKNSILDVTKNKNNNYKYNKFKIEEIKSNFNYFINVENNPIYLE